MDVAVQHIDGFLEWIQDYREHGFAAAETTAKELAPTMDVPCEYTPVKIRRKRRLFDYEGEDSATHTPRELFKTDYFLRVIDSISQSVKERFDLLNAFFRGFEILTNISSLRDANRTDVLTNCRRLAKALSHNDRTDTDGEGLWDELISLCYVIPEKSSATFVLKYVIDHSLTDAYPNTFVALRVFLTPPVTVAAAERSFSRLKLIKTYLHSTMSQERLSGLAILSIENEIASALDYSKLIDDFSKRNARKIVL
ncbi:uncharacterized protein LOC119582231 [Penaeus monodon]|uniref:uncharacterized protein LOC119582231 n=1 Tax=Penaeus monodon TaxID=6687 RepID=UPI0018A70C6B|nr:uncharacterized protein LOC119582231 [Penaeus monodon]